ncbi:tape measure protein [Bifidobacterium longum]|jgi:tape measure domain-containing protein|uniref:tape measure protein n=1 Tax=Bifidobacterium longum TaxID=216816 RepID=UPI00206F3F9B|nr:MAG TPA: tail tape measure [Caudoviricetes sp.]
MAYNLATAYVPIVPSMDGVGKAIEKAFGDASKTTGSKTGQSIGKGLSVGFASKVGAVAGITSNVFSKVASVVTSSLGSAVDRADQMNNFPKVMKNLGYSATDAAASIKKISDALDGLPTTSSAMTGMVQQLAPLTSNLDEATDIALAFNNAMLAGGASTMEQENALTQYTQMLSAGKVDMQAWRSIQAAMPGQLNQVAEAMMGAGHNANDLYEAMKSGKFSFDDFNKAVMDLNQNGFGKYASFAQQAKDATQGIGTAMENVKNRVAKAVQKVIDAVGVENIAGAINRFSSQFGKVGDAAAGMVTDVKKKFSEAGKWITGLYDKLDKTGAITRFKDTISTAFESARSRVTEAVDRIAGSFKGLVPDGAIVSAIEDVLKYVGTVFSDFADWVADTVEWWSKFIAALKDTGAVQQLAGALGSLFDAIGDVADAFRGAGDMAESAAGRFDSAKGSAELLGAVIKVAADLVQKMADQLKRVAEWVKKFTDTLSDSGALDTWMDALERIFSALGDALGSLKRLGKALDGGKKSAEGAGDGLDTAAAAAKGFAAYIGAVANVVETVAGVLDGIASAAGKLADGIDWLNEKFPILGQVIGFLLDPMGSLADMAGSLFSFFSGDAGATAVNDFTATFVEPVKAKLDEIGQWFQSLPQKAMDAGSQFLTNIGQWFQQLPQTIGYWLGYAIMLPIAFAQQLGSKAMEAGQNFVTNLSNWIQQLPSQIWTWLTQTIQNVQAWGSQMMAQAGDAGSQFLTGLGQWLQSLPGRIWQWLTGAISSVQAWGGQMGAGARNAGNQFLQGITGTLQSLPGRIQSLFSNAGSWLLSSGRSIMDGLAQGIRNGISAAVDAASNAMEAISKLFPHSPAKEGPFSGHGWTLYSGQSIIDGLAEGMLQRRAGLVDATRAAISPASMELMHGMDTPRPSVGTGTANGTYQNQSDELLAEIRSLHADLPLIMEKLGIEVDGRELGRVIRNAIA